jgi:tetratricopeptide (TPR) repeat protein
MDQAQKARPWTQRVWSRETVLLAALASLGIMIGITEVAVNFYLNKQTNLAKMWFQRGSGALSSGQPKQAVEDLRNAVSYAPANSALKSTYQLRLALALAASNRINEAESYLLVLWTDQPGNGEINLELAKLEARQGKPDAARYFENAIYGVWPSNVQEHRWQARMELLQFYRSTNNTGQARAELLTMAADTPATDFERLTQIGQLQLELGAPRQALQQFQQALKVKRRYAPALAGAGAAEFAIGGYRNAIPYLAEAVRVNPKNKQAAAQLELTRLVLDSDPFQIGLDEEDRAERSIDAYLQAMSKLTTCATAQGIILDTTTPQNPLQRMWASGQSQQALLTGFRGQPQTVLQLMNFVFSAENLAANECGPLQGKDQALWLIGKEHQLTGSGGQSTN